MDRQQAWEILCEFTKGESLRKHALSVEAVMRAYARQHVEDEERWGIVGLLHDFDYEIHPTADQHPVEGSKILAARGVPEEIRYAILCHADHTGVERRSALDKAIYAVDELTGFIIAVALVKPNKSLGLVDAPSVRKKMKDKAFARNVRREDLIKGAEQFGVELDAHIAFCVGALKPVASQLGLNP
ncbi:MAG: HDIG domain-containing protein [Dehalococcoidia bacterium]|nr:HDIG domain-containing protein [Dehalococcoidia bacterium]